MKITFSVALLVVVLAMACADLTSPPQTWKAAHDECLSQSKIKIENVRRHRNHIADEDKEEYGKYQFCFNKKIGLQNANGDINIKEVKNLVEYHQTEDKIIKVDEIATACGTRNSLDGPEETALVLIECLANHLGINLIH